MNPRLENSAIKMYTSLVLRLTQDGFCLISVALCLKHIERQARLYDTGNQPYGRTPADAPRYMYQEEKRLLGKCQSRLPCKAVK